MNGYNNNSYVDKYDEILNVRDLIATILIKWRMVLLVIIASCLLCVGYSLFKGNKSKLSELEIAKSKLSESEAEQVDALFEEYNKYIEYEKNANKYYSKFYVSDDELNNLVLKKVFYRFYSSASGLKEQLIESTLSEDVYEKIKQVSSDSELFSDASMRVTVTSNDDKDSDIEGEAESLLELSIIAANKEECNTIQEIVEKSLNTQIINLQNIVPETSLSYMGEYYDKDLRGWVLQKQIEYATYIRSNNEIMTAFTNNQINTLSESQKAYFNALSASVNNEQVEPTESVSKRTVAKWMLIGFVLGTLLAVGYILIEYILSGVIKTNEDLVESYHIPVLAYINTSNKNYLFADTIRKLKNVNRTNDINKISYIATDITNLLTKQNVDSVYFASVDNTVLEKQHADIIANAICKTNPKTTVYYESIIDNETGLKELAAADCVVLFVELNKTERKSLEQYLNLCARYKALVLGAVTLENI